MKWAQEKLKATRHEHQLMLMRRDLSKMGSPVSRRWMESANGWKGESAEGPLVAVDTSSRRLHVGKSDDIALAEVWGSPSQCCSTFGWCRRVVLGGLRALPNHSDTWLVTLYQKNMLWLFNWLNWYVLWATLVRMSGSIPGYPSPCVLGQDKTLNPNCSHSCA